MQLVKYDEARQALEACATIDEVKVFSDKAVALEAYARQIHDVDMEVWVANIKLRAKRKIGEYSKQLEKAKDNQYTKSAKSSNGLGTLTKNEQLKQAGLTKQTANRCEKLLDVSEEVFEEALIDAKKNKKAITYADIEKKITKDDRRTKAEERKKVPDDLPDKSERYELIHSNFQDADIKKGSIDVIITDPPYPKEYLHVYGELAEFANYVLKPGAMMVVMCGQSYLPQILNDMSSKIDYLWTAAYLTPGQSLQVFPRKAAVSWKPLLLFSKGKYKGDWYGDVCKSGNNDKNHHHWGQSESGMSDIIQKFSLPKQTILDPFCGGGTTGLVGLELGRNFIGIDCDIDCINTTKGRIHGGS